MLHFLSVRYGAIEMTVIIMIYYTIKDKEFWGKS